MYNTSEYNEDIHINNDGDEELIEAVFTLLDEANRKTKAARRNEAAKREFEANAYTAQQNNPPANVPKPAPQTPPPAPTTPPTTSNQPTASQPQSAPAATKEKPDVLLTLGNAVKKADKGPRTVTGNLRALRQDLKNIAEHRAEGNSVQELLSRDDAKQHAIGALKSAGRGALKATVVGVGQQAIRDYASTGDPLYTAKKIKRNMERKAAIKRSEREKSRRLREYNKWKNKNAKKRLVSESCTFILDESTGVSYYVFDPMEVSP